MLKRYDDSALRMALGLKSEWQEKARTIKDLEEAEKIGLKMKDALHQVMWRDGVRRTAEGMG